MDLKEIDATGVDPRAHWYYQTKKLPLIDYFEKLSTANSKLNIVDIGAGSGFFSDCLIEADGQRVNDVSRVDIGYERERSSRDERIAGRLSESRELPEAIENSLILMMDVLEHVPDDKAFLASVVARCRGKNHFFITVPACMSLWSAHDLFLEHYRRYTLAQLENVAARAGIKVTSSYYIYGFIFPLVWLARRGMGAPKEPKCDLKPAHPLVGLLLKFLCRGEFVFRKGNRLFGVTCVLEGFVE